jgi:hypothetical protein
MRRRPIALALTALAVAVAALFVLVPAFPEPSELISSDYAALQSRLGAPTVVFGDKFVGWARPRFVATWTLEAGLEFPLRPQARPAEIHRCLWIYWAGYAILCRWAYAAPHEVGHASAQDSASALPPTRRKVSELPEKSAALTMPRALASRL